MKKKPEVQSADKLFDELLFYEIIETNLLHMSHLQFLVHKFVSKNLNILFLFDHVSIVTPIYFHQ